MSNESESNESERDWLDLVNWNSDGLLPVIAQQTITGKVLMLAWMNRQALAESAASGEAVYWSRSRRRLWRKGESSGHVQKIKAMRLDCDNDTLLLEVEQVGDIACHTGRQHCFFRQLGDDGIWHTVDAVKKDPQEIYRQ